MDLFLKNYREAVEKSDAFNISFFKYTKAVFDVGTTTRDVERFGWPVPPNTTAVNLEINWASAIVHCQVILTDEDDMPDLLMANGPCDFVPLVDFDSVMRAAASHSEYLILLLSAMLKQYNSYVMSRLPVGCRLSEQVAELLGSQRFKELHWEAFGQQQQQQQQQQGSCWQWVNLQLSLPLDFEKLTAALLQRYPRDEMCAQLLLKFTDYSLGKRVPAELKMSPSLKNLLQDYQISLKIPDFDANSSSLVLYFSRVLETLQQRVDSIGSSFTRRRELIEILRERHRQQLVEFDSDDYLSVSFMFEWNDFRFVALIELPREFPHPTQPWCVTLRSVYHHRKAGARAPFEKKFDSPPYSPRWPPAEMADRLEALLLNSVQQFQRESVTSA